MALSCYKRAISILLNSSWKYLQFVIIQINAMFLYITLNNRGISGIVVSNIKLLENITIYSVVTKELFVVQVLTYSISSNLMLFYQRLSHMSKQQYPQVQNVVHISSFTSLFLYLC